MSLIGFRNILKQKAVSDFWGNSRTNLKEVSHSGYFCCGKKQIMIIYPAERKEKKKNKQREKKKKHHTIWVYFNRKAPSGTYFKGISCFIF